MFAPFHQKPPRRAGKSRQQKPPRCAGKSVAAVRGDSSWRLTADTLRNSITGRTRPPSTVRQPGRWHVTPAEAAPLPRSGEDRGKPFQLSTPYLETLVRLEYTVARTVARRAGASLLTASPTVPACRPAYAADLRAIGRLAMGRMITALILCNIAHARHLSTGFLRTRLRRWPGITNLQVLCHDCNRRVPGRLNRT
jgi:hypothetical protein